MNTQALNTQIHINMKTIHTQLFDDVNVVSWSFNFCFCIPKFWSVFASLFTWCHLTSHQLPLISSSHQLHNHLAINKHQHKICIYINTHITHIYIARIGKPSFYQSFWKMWCTLSIPCTHVNKQTTTQIYAKTIHTHDTHIYTAISEKASFSPSLLPSLSNLPSFNLAHMAINRQQHKHMQKQHKHRTDIYRVRIEKDRFSPSLCNLYCNLPSFNLAHIATNKKQHKHMQKQHTHMTHIYKSNIGKASFYPSLCSLVVQMVHQGSRTCGLEHTQILLICTHMHKHIKHT